MERIPRLIDGLSRAVAAAVALALACAPQTGWARDARHRQDPPAAAKAERTARYFDQVRDQPVALAMFLRLMPKGGDLHNHLAGAIYAETLIGWAKADGLCVDSRTFSLAPPPCRPGEGAPPVAEAIKDPAVYVAMLDAFSMRDFVPSAGRSGHDQFFDSFGHFDPAFTGHWGDALAEAADRAAADHVLYLELMLSPGMDEARDLAAHTAWSEDFDALDTGFAAPLGPIAARASAWLDAAEARERQDLACDTPRARPGCAVTIRYLAQVIRTVPPAAVFAQSQLGFALAARDRRVVGVNLVAPEDDPITLRDYDRQMRLLAYLSKRDPATPLSLHAGELTLGLVPPQDLRFHIREAVEVAGARRIGHGVDLKYEDDAAGLLRDMARRKVMVEINLTSNDGILGVKGRDHPLSAYRAAGVPVALSTDDEGVSRIDLTHEYERAATTYGLGYAELKAMARNSLEYSFVGGDSLWANSAPFRLAPACFGVTPGAKAPPKACRALLAASARARLQWALEAAFADFEATDWAVK